MQSPTAVRYLLISPDNEVTEGTAEFTVDTLFDLIGAPFTVAPSDGDLTAFVAEEVSPSMRFNWVASNLLRQHMNPDDRVMGYAVLTGPPDSAGDPTDVSDEVISRVRASVPRSR